MISRAEAKYIRISSYRVRQVVPLIKGMKAVKALNVLSVVNKRAAYCLNKVLKSAVANAKHKGYEEDGLVVANVIANNGPTLRRYRAASFGRAGMLRKPTSHIIVEIDSKEKLVATKGSKKK